MEFNEKLQELRKTKGLTQEELAEALYVSRAAISKWESGRGYPSIDSLKEISKFFSVTIDELICTEEIIIAAKDERQNALRKFAEFILTRQPYAGIICFSILIVKGILISKMQ